MTLEALGDLDRISFGNVGQDRERVPKRREIGESAFPKIFVEEKLTGSWRELQRSNEREGCASV